MSNFENTEKMLKENTRLLQPHVSDLQSAALFNLSQALLNMAEDMDSLRRKIDRIESQTRKG